VAGAGSEAVAFQAFRFIFGHSHFDMKLTNVANVVKLLQAPFVAGHCVCVWKCVCVCV